MSGTSNSISSLLAQFLRLQQNQLEIISKLSEATTSSADSVTATLLMDDGSKKTTMIPTFGAMKADITRHDNDIKALAGLGDSSAIIKMADGTVKQVFSASILRDPVAVSSLNVPKNFKVKNNWFFESFLNPLLFVGFDVTGKVPENMSRAVVKRVLANCDTQEKKDFFDLFYKGKNDVDYEDFLTQLDANDIEPFFDEEIVDLPLSVVRYTGTFDVLKVWDETTNLTSNDRTITVQKRKYKLSKLTYSDVLSGTSDSKTLQINDVLLTGDGSKYRIDSIDSAENTVVLKRIAGYQPVTIGADVFDVYSPAYSSKEIQVNVGYDERQVIFVKPIEAVFGVASSKFSPGVGVWTNELVIQTPAGTTTLEDFYKNQVVDFGMLFLNSAKEKLIPSTYGEIPDAPTLAQDNFRVIQVNAHKKDTKQADDIRTKLSSKVSLDNEIRQIDDAINTKKNDLNNNAASKSEAERKKIKSDLETLARDKSSKVNRFSSVVKELSTKLKENPAILEDAKFRVRGFWPIPTAKTSEKTHSQEVIQFRVAYRYIRKDGSATPPEQIEFMDNDGAKKRGYFSNWNEITTGKRGKNYDSKTGFFTWATEDVADGDAVNINQLDIPISKGEQVQIKIKSISEAGWPLNPIESEWSEPITIDFPNDLQIADDSAALLKEAHVEESRVKLQEELNARGLDQHLAKAFTSGDKYYPHVASDIASEFVTSEGKVINLFEKLKQIDTELQRLRQIIEKARGALSISIIDSDGNLTKITPNLTAKLFAGFYKELIKTGSGNSITYNHGRIITKEFVIRIENSAASPLELASYMPGGNSVPVDSYTNPNVLADYSQNRKYDLVPVSLTSANSVLSGSPQSEAPFQSNQVKGLWMYSRYKSVGLDEDLYADGTGTITAVPTFTSFQNGPHLHPYRPGYNSGAWGINSDVWNGTVTANAANGNGYLNEFCIHKGHPDAQAAYTAGAPNGTFFTSALATSGTSWIMQYPKFLHAQYFNEDIASTTGRKQLRRYVPAAATSATIDFTNYPVKLGFAKNDEWLIGKYTCGAYLFIAPKDYTAINVDGSTELAKTTLEFGEDKGINIPLIFQFRCSDKLERVGGYRTNGDISNITYFKKIGIDIQVRGEALFSFDVEVTCKYEQDALVTPLYPPNVALDRLDTIRGSGTSAL